MPKLFGWLNKKVDDIKSTTSSPPPSTPIPPTSVADPIEQRIAFYMRELHNPENQKSLAAMRQQVDGTAYWKKLVTGDTEAEKNQGRDTAIKAVLTFLLRDHPSQDVQIDMSEHWRTYLPAYIEETDTNSHFQEAAPWVARSAKPKDALLRL